MRHAGAHKQPTPLGAQGRTRGAQGLYVACAGGGGFRNRPYVFDSLKINDPRLQAWTQVHAAIRLIGGKIQEQKTLRARIEALDSEIEGVRSLASELVSNAYRGEQEVHETSKLRMQIAESLHEKLLSTLKN